MPVVRTADRLAARARGGQRLQGAVALQADGRPPRDLPELPRRTDDQLGRVAAPFTHIDGSATVAGNSGSTELEASKSAMAHPLFSWLSHHGRVGRPPRPWTRTR